MSELQQTSTMEEGQEVSDSARKEGELLEDQEVQTGGGPSNEDEAGDSDDSEDEDTEDILVCADELMQRGSEKMKEKDYANAADYFSRAVEIRVGHYGELAPECVSSYYKYGCALLYKAQEEADPLGTVPQKKTVSPANSAAEETVKIEEDCESSCTAAVGNAKQAANNNNDDCEDGRGMTYDLGQDGEDLSKAEEEDSDLDLAWKLLDVARAISEKQPGDTLEKVDIMETLAEVSLEREDIETSISDYQKALSMLENLVEPDSRHIAELNFRICLAFELGSKTEEAVSYCEKAISVCKSRLQRLQSETNIPEGATKVVNGGSTDKLTEDVNQLSGEAHIDFSISEKLEEIKTLDGLSNELEKKLEDLQQSIINPKSILSEAFSFGSRSTGIETGTPSKVLKIGRSDVMSSSQMGVITGSFDSPTASTATTKGHVTHLGVVGRGVKRATSATTSADPFQKKQCVESVEGKDDSSSQV